METDLFQAEMNQINGPIAIAEDVENNNNSRNEAAAIAEDCQFEEKLKAFHEEPAIPTKASLESFWSVKKNGIQ